MAPRIPQPWTTEQEFQWRATQLLYQTVDIKIMEMKLRTKEYTKLAQFHADVLSMQHNVAVFHGKDSQEMESSKLMLQDCKYDLDELVQCQDCYRHSNEKSNSNWFCIPCKVPHALVWAKQKGYPYWPAKVIKVTNDQYDVRFFGAKHLRAVVDKNSIKPIETDLQSLNIKKTAPFHKAMQELRMHQDLLHNNDEVAKLLVNAEAVRNKKSTKRYSLTNTGSKQSNQKKQKLSTSTEPYQFHQQEIKSDELDDFQTEHKIVPTLKQNQSKYVVL